MSDLYTQAEKDGYVQSSVVNLFIEDYLSWRKPLHRTAWWLFRNTDWFYEMVKGISIIAQQRIEEVEAFNAATKSNESSSSEEKVKEFYADSTIEPDRHQNFRPQKEQLP